MAAFALDLVFGDWLSFFALNPSLDINRYAHTALAQKPAGKT
jgi:hypothetical protein